MTKVKLVRFGKCFEVAAEGHATGSTECCAAISVLLYTLAGWLHNEATVTILQEKLQSADSFLSFSGAGAAAKTAFDLITIGFLQLERAMPEYLRVEREEK